ncbi:DUF6221 family protein [Streptomyces chartreusis]|uniref:DUF6221 family protein n=1 Tax=Streptomyces chartreusis TaxID=1969 RepID=UPI00123D3D26|nr:DUF6221 family protein [Streptomyces chartreusis]QEV66193.1 hypothetical protein CP983_05645 [Streptomyces chartreusis]GGW98561.1 hypothetical protein GCM10010321_11150 [Streptomyces chartreusis]
MTDLHGWITQQIKRYETAANDATDGPWFAEHPDEAWGEQKDAYLIGGGKCLATLRYDRNGHLNVDHIELNEPAAVLRRCAADRKILEVHEPVGYERACDGCGFDREEGYYVDHINDCPTLLALAEGYGLTPAILATLDRPEPLKPAYKPRGPLPDTSRVPPALRGPNWKARR